MRAALRRFARGRVIRRAAIALLAVASLGAGLPYAADAVRAAASDCPGNIAAGDTREFAVLLGRIRAQRGGSGVDVTYDVCGLTSGARFTTRFAVARQRAGADRLPAAGELASPVVTLRERAAGPATHRRRRVAVGPLAPGAYTLYVVVADGSGRRRHRTANFRVQR